MASGMQRGQHHPSENQTHTGSHPGTAERQLGPCNLCYTKDIQLRHGMTNHSLRPGPLPRPCRVRRLLRPEICPCPFAMQPIITKPFTCRGAACHARKTPLSKRDLPPANHATNLLVPSPAPKVRHIPAYGASHRCLLSRPGPPASCWHPRDLLSASILPLCPPPCGSAVPP